MSNQAPANHAHCHHHEKKKRDYFFYSILILSALAYSGHLLGMAQIHLSTGLTHFCHSFFTLINTMSWGIALGILFVGILGHIPRDYIFYFLGQPQAKGSILRATASGVLLDLCSHGILMVGMKLYQRGASLGQVMAFLIASPWNSFSLTVILISLIGIPWTLAFIVLSAIIAIISGIIFDILVNKKILPANPNEFIANHNFDILAQLKSDVRSTKFSWKLIPLVIRDGVADSKVIIKWVFFGALLSSLIKVLVSDALFKEYFGPSLIGLMATLVVTTIIEVCSEGSTPIAADILTRASAPGNSFTFLMAGVATDYTEVMTIRESMNSWKIALFLPLITVPQILLIGFILNYFS